MDFQIIRWIEKRLETLAHRLIVASSEGETQTLCYTVHVSVYGNSGLFRCKEQNDISRFRSDTWKLKKSLPCVPKRF